MAKPKIITVLAIPTTFRLKLTNRKAIEAICATTGAEIGTTINAAIEHWLLLRYPGFALAAGVTQSGDTARG